MAVTAAQGERYTIRRKVFRLLGNAFHVFNAEGEIIGFCDQKRLRLKEDIRFYTDASKSEELLTLKARSIIDFGATYDISLPTGELIGSLRRKGMKSTFVRDEWRVFDEAGEQIGSVQEKGAIASVLRRLNDYAALLSPQKLELWRHTPEQKPAEGTQIATLRRHFNPFIYRLGVAVHTEDEQLDDLMLLAIGCLIAAIEGRQG